MDFSGEVCIIYPMFVTLNHLISQTVAEVFDLYTELHGTRVSLFGPDKEMLYPDDAGRPNCRYCRMLRETLGLDARCRALDQKMMEAAREKREMISYTCHGGMHESVAPLFSGGELAGFVMIGQFRSCGAPAASPYAEQWQQQQGNDALQQEFDRSTVLSEEKIQKLLAMFSRLLEMIISSRLIHHKDYDLIAPVIEQIAQHPEQPLSLEEASAMSGRSASTVTRLFKRMTGTGFKQYQLSARLKFAAALLESSPNRPVADIAAAVGFEDPLYFSRIFRKHIGVSPSGYRDSDKRLPLISELP
ncbi:MAG: PocR ligand-binding domain-containing protein [Kiritimatiellales bacterium]